MASPTSPSCPAPETSSSTAPAQAEAGSEACPECDPFPVASEACPDVRPRYEKDMESVVCVLKAAASAASGISPAVVNAGRKVKAPIANVLLLGEAAADLVKEKAMAKGDRPRWEEAAEVAGYAVKNLDSAQEHFSAAQGRLTAAGLAAEIALDALREELRSAPEPPQPPQKRSRN